MISSELFEYLGDDLLEIHAEPDKEVIGVTCDSRAIKSGVVFVAVKGSLANGEDFICDAIEEGALFVVSENAPSKSVPWVRVKSATRALSCLAELLAGRPAEGFQVIGITGTNGKTSTAFILEHILCENQRKTGVVGTIHNRFGDKVETSTLTTPDAVSLQRLYGRMSAEKVDSVIIEVSSHALTQNRLGTIPVNTAIFTNLTQDHLDYHGDMESYYQAKRCLFGALLDSQGRAIINVDDIAGRRLAEEIESGSIIRVGQRDADIVISDICCGAHFISYTLQGHQFEMALTIPLQGMFNVYNSALAAVAALEQGLTQEQVQSSLETFSGIPGRMELFTGSDGRRVYVDYAHTPDALSKALKVLRPFAEKLICLFGCGGDRDKTKRPLMAEAAEEMADLVILTDDNPRTEEPQSIIADIHGGFVDAVVYTEPDRYRAIEYAVKQLGPEDILLVAGKGHENYQIYGIEKQDFCDRNTVKAILGGRSA